MKKLRIRGDRSGEAIKSDQCDFANALRDVLGLEPLYGPSWKSVGERFSAWHYPDVGVEIVMMEPADLIPTRCDVVGFFRRTRMFKRQ